MPQLPLTGGCGCGGVRFEINQPLVGAAYCHCTRCQRRTGTSASATALLRRGSLRITQGEHLLRDWRPPEGAPKTFCSECGSAVFGRDPESGEIIYVRLGVFDSDPGVRLLYRQYVDYAAAWEEIPEDGLPRRGEAFSS
jgi:hypothetical protein